MISIKRYESLFTCFKHFYNEKTMLLFIKLYWFIISKSVIFIRLTTPFLTFQPFTEQFFIINFTMSDLSFCVNHHHLNHKFLSLRALKVKFLSPSGIYGCIHNNLFFIINLVLLIIICPYFISHGIIIYFLSIYLYIWVLVAHPGSLIFFVACGIYSHGVWDLVP